MPCEYEEENEEDVYLEVFKLIKIIVVFNPWIFETLFLTSYFATLIFMHYMDSIS